MPPAFYEQLDERRFRATPATVGPWDPRHQHAGPPAALLARAVERCATVRGLLVRLTCEILAPVPVADLTVDVRTVRPGRRIELLAATLSHDGQPVMAASAWCLRTEQVDVPAPGARRPALPETTSALPAYAAPGYLTAMEWRWVHGGFDQPGAATVWGRMRQPLVDGEEPSGVQRAAVLADSGNGVSAVLDPRHWLFVNTELTVHLHREPLGEWVCLSAATLVQPSGVGVATSTVYDLDGPVGSAAQALLVAPR